MKNTISTFLKINYDELKDEIKCKWEKLTDNDLLQIEGSYDALLNKLKETYKAQKDYIEDELFEFLSQFWNSKKLKQEMGDCPAIQKYIDDSLEYLKEKSTTIQKKSTQHVKENPFKWMAVATISGIILAKLINL